MATGDVTDCEARLRALLPPWFPNTGSAPVADGVVAGIATLLSLMYGLIAYARSQTRIRSAFGGWLDLIAWDFFGARMVRNPGESDTAYLARILPELTRRRVTRSAIQQALVQLTGFPVRIIEAWLPSDVGVIDGMYLDVDTPATPGRIGAPDLACQFFVECVLPLTQLFGNNVMPAIDVNLYIDTPPTGYIMDVESNAPTGAAAVYALVNAMRAAGVICWLRFVPVPTAVQWDQPGAKWDTPGVSWDH